MALYVISPPERLGGQCSARSDVYSLGVSLYELLVLKPIFANTDHVGMLNKIQNEEPAPLESVDRRIPRDLRTIVARAMAKRPDRRYATAGALADDLSRFIDGRPIHARRVSTLEKALIWAKRNPVLSAVTSFLVLVLIGTAVGSTLAALKFNGNGQ